MNLRDSKLVSLQTQEASAARRGWIKSLALGIVAALMGRSSLTLLFAQTPAIRAASAEKSVQLHIYIEVKPGKGGELEALYHSAYVPAIKIQDGFVESRLLRHYDSSSRYEIDISFKTEKERAAWAQSKEHQATWPKIQELGAKISAQGFDQLA